VWLKQMVDRNSALAGGVLYMATPYHLAGDLYVRGSLAEFWAFIWMPLILFFTHKIVNGSRLAVAGFAVSYALLVMTHLPTTVIFSPLPLCYAIYLAGAGQKVKSSALILSAITLGAGLSCIYLWPAMTTQHFVFLERMTTGYFSYKNWLFFTNLSLWSSEKFLVLLTVIDLTGVACCAFAIARVNSNKMMIRLSAFWCAVAAAGILMMTQLSAPIWAALPLLQKIQFPWRFNAIVSLATTALLALAFSSLKERQLASVKIAKTIGLLLIIAWIPATGWAVWQAYPFHNPDPEEINYKKREIEQDREVPEYYPRWNASMASMDWQTSTDEEEWDRQLNRRFDELERSIGESEGGLSKVKIVAGTGKVNIRSWKPGEIRLQADTPTGMWLNVSQFYYPNWTAQIASDLSDVDIQPSQPDGVISLFVPGGEHQVLLRFKQSSTEKLGQLISLISIIITLGCLVRHKYTS